MIHVIISSCISWLCMGVIAFAQSPVTGLRYVTMLEGWRADKTTHYSAIEIALEKNWKTYWRVAGVNGITPIITWDKSKNIKSVDIIWPIPKVFHDFNTQTIGYKNNVILPLKIAPHNPNKPMHLDGMINFGICNHICIPVSAQLKAALSPTISIKKHIIKAALKQQIKPVTTKHIKSLLCDIKPIEGGFAIEATINAYKLLSKNTAMIIEYPLPDLTSLQHYPTEIKGATLYTKAYIYNKKNLMLNREKIRLTVISPHNTYEINGCLSKS